MTTRPVVLPTTVNVDRPIQAGYEGRIDELLLRMSITPESQLEINLVPAQAPRIALGGALQAIPDAALVASLGDVSGGEGLFHTSRARTDLDQTRYWRSRGIDTSAGTGGRSAGFGLLHRTESALADLSAATPYMVSLGQEVLYCSGPDVKTVSSPLSAVGVTTEDPFVASTNALTGLVKIGGDVWASMNAAAGLSKRAFPGPTWSVPGSALGNVIGLWAAKDRLFAQVGNVLHEVNQTSGASSAVILTLPAGAVVTDVADAGDAILVAADTGKVYSFALDSSAALQLASEVRVGLSDNEFVSCIGAGFGLVLMGTREATTASGSMGRLYVAELSATDSGHRLVNIALVRTFPNEPSANDLRHPTRIAFRGASAYIAVIGNDESMLWRYQLATRGLSEDLVIPLEAAIYGLAVLENRFIFALAGVGLWREDENYLADGWIMSPISDFGYATQKAWAWINLIGQGLGAGNTVEVALAADEEAMDDPNSVLWTRVLVIFDDAGLGALAPVFDYAERAVAMKVDLNSGGSNTPRVSVASVYAYPVADELRIRMPINVSDRIERPGRTPINVRGWGNHYFRDILSRRGLPGELELYRQQLVVRGRISDVATSTPGRGERGSGLLITWVTFEGRATAIGATPFASGTTLGLDMLGIGILGV